ncbi:MAG: hypothetical protein GX858_04290, partial [Clostridiales bacterium]|nr:hypothetical protein [Clostridiales bacterium]
EWNASTIAYTDHRGHPTAYVGEYIRTKNGATAFEAMLARVMDQLVRYESSKYKQQHLVSFINDPQHDPFVYDPQVAKRLAKFCQLDIEHLEATDNFESGLFASYRVYQFVPDFWLYLSKEQKQKLGDLPDRVDKSQQYDGYTQLLAEYHTMPVIIVSFSYSSARGMADMHKEARLTERRQGEMLVDAYKDIIASGCNGAVVSGLTDYWGQRTWNASYAVDLNRTYMWHDLQSSAQGTGLLAFVPGENNRIVTVDGDSSEWFETEPLLEKGGLKLYVKYDEEGLYLSITGDVSPAVPLYVSFDLTPKTGSKTFSDARLQFYRGIDFVLELKGENGESRLMVQERYEALRANFLYETQRQDAYVNPPDKDSELFVPILQAVIPLVFQPQTPAGQVPPAQYSTIETGILVEGNADADSENYNSLADYCYGPGVVEVRIPWAMLNFSDPSRMMIHDDYYENYGVKSIAINKMEIGLTAAGGRTEFQTLPLNGWDTVPVHLRRKQSYYILQQEWRRRL